jgi:hypothetical protein
MLLSCELLFWYDRQSFAPAIFLSSLLPFCCAILLDSISSMSLVAASLTKSAVMPRNITCYFFVELCGPTGKSAIAESTEESFA